MITLKNIVEHLKNGKVKTSMVYPMTKKAHFVTLEDLLIKLSNEEIVKIPKGFEFDGSSSPRFLWWCFPPYGNFFFAAIIHDFLYSTNHSEDYLGTKGARKFADKEMLIWSNLLNNSNFGKLLDNKMRYLAVRLFGKKVFVR